MSPPMPSAPPPVRYRIVPHDRTAHRYEVSVSVDVPAADGQLFRLPTWIPGSYLIREFARHFVSVRATGNGQPVAIAKTRKDTWQVAPCAGPLTVTAEVYAYDMSVRTAYLDAQRGYFNGAAVFLCPVGHEHAPCIVDIVAPAGGDAATWQVSTTLLNEAAPDGGFGTYRAADYDELIDHPVETGVLATASFVAGGVPHDIAVAGRQQGDLPRLARDLTRVCQWQIDFFGGAPFARYLFQIAAVTDGYGGLEHRASTSLICRRNELPRVGDSGVSDDYLTLLGLASHEYFHAWNVKRIKPAAFMPYDLTQENYTRQLWAFEGITSYYDDLALLRCGLIDAPRYLELLARAITTMQRAPGRHVQSVGDSSFDAWIKFYRADENTPNAVISYYGKGSLVACLLDLELRRDGTSSLDVLMRALWDRYGKPGVGVPEGAIAALASELAGRDLDEFFKRYVDGVDELPLAAMLADVGVELTLRPSTGTRDRGGKPAAGPVERCTLGIRVGSDMKVGVVLRDGPAARAGLSAGDVLVAIDGMKATTDALAALAERGVPDADIRLHAFRRDELITVDVTLAPAPDDTCVLALAPAPSSAALARRIAWLGA
ncbi:MAG: PDZ domain-containing protein [Betaproteobacteria bacterium]